jgi:hypothetical protein
MFFVGIDWSEQHHVRAGDSKVLADLVRTDRQNPPGPASSRPSAGASS